MLKNETDYSNTIIYKITCKNSEVSDIYVGHTTNFVQRKYAHKQSCINSKSLNYKCKLYEVIRNNGGWINWKMEIIYFFDCNNQYEARQKEQEYFVLLKANLNSIEPKSNPVLKLKTIPKPKTISNPKTIPKHALVKFFCDKCNFRCIKLEIWEKHNLSKKHNDSLTPDNTNDGIVINDNNIKNTEKVSKFSCNLCNFNCNVLQQWNRHIETNKHNMKTNIEVKTFNCICSKKYIHRQSLFNHKKMCSFTPNNVNNVNNVNVDNSNITLDTNKQILLLLKQNQELQMSIMKLIKENNSYIIDN